MLKDGKYFLNDKVNHNLINLHIFSHLCVYRYLVYLVTGKETINKMQIIQS